MNIKQIYQNYVEEHPSTNRLETPEYNRMYEAFCAKHPDTEKDLTDIVYFANEIAFTEGFKAATSLLLEGKGDVALDQKWSDFELDIAADLESVIYIASALYEKLSKDCENGKCKKEHAAFAFGLLRALQGIDASRAARVYAIAGLK
jgi:hypothetical protein